MAGKTTTTTDEWSDLSKASFGVFQKTGTGKTRVNVEEEIPKPIRQKLEDLFALFNADYETPTGKVIKAGTAKYQDHNFGSNERAEAFAKMARRYGQYRPEGRATVRATVFAPKGEGEASWVHFTMKPLEVRNG